MVELKSRYSEVAIGILLTVCAFTTSAPAQESLAKQLLQEGIQLTEGVKLPLAAPALSADQTADERLQTLSKLAGNLGWSRFERDSVVAPVKIELEYILNDSGTRLGHDIHTAFVAYAPLEKLRDEELIREIFGGSSSGPSAGGEDAGEEQAVQEVPDEELDKLGIDVPESDNERYAVVEIPLLNRVTVNGVIRIEKLEGPGWLQLFWHIDPRFAKSDKYPNTWTKIERDELGKPVATEPQPYRGCGGYLSITEIDPDRDQLLIESRMILHEPVDWFAGSNALRSKLPPVLQENARTFRRRVSK